MALIAGLQVAAIDWEALPPLPYRAPPLVTAEMHGFVAREAKAGRCPHPAGELRVDVAVLIDEAGGIRTTVPRAIQCAPVEQYAAALVAGFARGNLLPRMATGEQWYRTSLTFTLPK
ncbi:hypothetical protein [Sphingomonas sp.]|uniref:hypothetical protein n=1 Tax=Sphingomonas sp. TaxID=28214 RepID=UPI0025E5921C|nr:hypothetical protein [Sphingomonas sp.]